MPPTASWAKPSTAERAGVVNGSAVADFERAFAQYVGAGYAIALNSGTSTLHTALAALGVRGSKVSVPPLTMSATTIAVLHAGAVPVFVDVDPDTWLMDTNAPVPDDDDWMGCVPVSLYGLHAPTYVGFVVDDAAQTLRPHTSADFTSYSFQSSKILALGEGGMLVTDDERLATRAREFSSLGYRMRADQPRIDPATLKSPDHERHHSLGWNYRMADAVAERGLYGPHP
jgi:perosamine synthetase